MTSPDEDPVHSTLDTNLSYRISILHSLLGKLTTRIYASRGLTSHQWKVLSILYNWPPMPAVRITTLVTLDKAAISRGVSGLLRLKFARRYLDNTSGMIFIALTDAGRASYRAMATEMGNLQRELFADVPDARQKQFFETVRELEQGLRAATGAKAADSARGRARKAREVRPSPPAKTSARKAKARMVGS
jgi:DNA-binding MarR family transcriptional regulator